MSRHESCNEWEELLALRLEDLSSADRASLEAHLAVCPSCAAINDHYRRIQASLTALPTPTMEPISYAWKRESGREEGELRQEPLEDILKRHYDYIRTLARQYASKMLFHDELEEACLVDELVQETIVKLYSALNRGSTANLQAYIKRIVQTVCVDLVRRNRGPAYILDQSADVVETSHPSPVDAEQQEQRDLMDKLIEQVLILPPRQRWAILCSLKEHIDDTPLLAETLLRYNVNIRSINWPEEEQEKQRLSSSLAIARKKLRQVFSQQPEREDQLKKAQPHSIGQIEALFGIV